MLLKSLLYDLSEKKKINHQDVICPKNQCDNIL